MMRFIHNICVTVRGDSVPMKAPHRTRKQAVTFTVSWNRRKRWIFWYSERPHITAFPILLNELSMIVISDASFATLVPSPIDRPTWAARRAGASFVPSPVTATTWFFFCKVSTRRFLSIGRAREIIFKSRMRSWRSASDNAANSGPVMMLRSVSSVSFQRPIWRAISFAVPDVSPVTIFTLIPASTHSLTAEGTSSLTGSAMAAIPMKQSLSATILLPSTAFSPSFSTW